MRHQSVLDFTLWGGGPHQDGTITWVPREKEAGKASQELTLDPILIDEQAGRRGPTSGFTGA